MVLLEQAAQANTSASASREAKNKSDLLRKANNAAEKTMIDFARVFGLDEQS